MLVIDKYRQNLERQEKMSVMIFGKPEPILSAYM